MIRVTELAQGAQPLVDVAELGDEPLPAMSAMMPLADDTAGFRSDQVDFGQQQRAPVAPSARPVKPIPSATPPTTTAPRAISQRPERRPQSSSWPIWVLIFLAGLGTAAAVGFTGPRLRRGAALAPAAPATPAARTSAPAPSRNPVEGAQ